MKKADIIKAVAERANVTKKVAETAVNTITDCIIDALSRGDIVRLVGFGTFSVRKRAARKARNPRTGDVINVPAKKVPRFQPGRKLRDVVK
jgi:DNA-binding protein HU-beta